MKCAFKSIICAFHKYKETKRQTNGLICSQDHPYLVGHKFKDWATLVEVIYLLLQIKEGLPIFQCFRQFATSIQGNSKVNIYIMNVNCIAYEFTCLTTFGGKDYNYKVVIFC